MIVASSRGVVLRRLARARLAMRVSLRAAECRRTRDPIHRIGALLNAGQRMIRRKPAPDSIRGGRRFADKNMRQSKNPERVPISPEKEIAPSSAREDRGLDHG